MTPEAVPAMMTIILVCAAVWADFKRATLPNVLVVAVGGLGLVLNRFFLGDIGLMSSLGGIALALGLWTLNVTCGRCLGAGELKLLGVVGALLGAGFLLAALALISVVGTLQTLGILAERRQLVPVIAECVGRLRSALGGAQRGLTQATASSLQVPYVMPIALGVLVSLLSSHSAG